MLAGPIKRPFRSSFVVGNLAREEARTYFFDFVMPFHSLPAGATEAWERVYEVCGGNPGDLGTCALEVAKFSSWELGANDCLLALLRCCASHLSLRSFSLICRLQRHRAGRDDGHLQRPSS